MTNGSGTVQANYSYDPYGRRIKTGVVESDFQFAGNYRHAPSGLYLTKTRLYSVAFGRFTSRDLAGESGGTNLYSYTNDPIAFVDPMGLSQVSPSGLAQATGYPNVESAVQQAGCRGVVDSALNIQSIVPGAYLPEKWIALYPNQFPTKCFWGKGNDTAPAVKQCTGDCPAGQTKVVWCKQGNFDSVQAGAPGSEVTTNLAVSMRTIGESYNYSVYTPGGYQGANSPETQPGQTIYINEPSPLEGGNFHNSICCHTCIKSYGR